MALASIQRAKREKIRNTCPVPERNCRLLLTTDTLDFSQPPPANEITGKLCIDNTSNETINLSGILIRCEINEIIRFGLKSDGVMTAHSKVNNVLADESWANVYVFGKNSTVSTLILPSGRLEYPFVLSPGNEVRRLPGTTKFPHGTVLYQIVAYIQRSYPEVPDQSYFIKLISSPPIRNPGYFNLALDPLAAAPISMDKVVQKSFFSKKSAYKATLSVPRTGFLPGDSIPFSIALQNIIGESFNKLSLSLVRKIIFKTESETKTMSTVLASKLTKNFGREAENSTWTDALVVPEGMGPSFVGAIEFLYLLRMEIHCSERVPVKGEIPILVGTTWGDREEDVPDSAPRPQLTKQMSATVRQSSTESMVSTVSAPPNYSQLSSRQSSIETLPPGYEEDKDSAETRLAGIQLED